MNVISFCWWWCCTLVGGCSPAVSCSQQAICSCLAQHKLGWANSGLGYGPAATRISIRAGLEPPCLIALAEQGGLETTGDEGTARSFSNICKVQPHGSKGGLTQNLTCSDLAVNIVCSQGWNTSFSVFPFFLTT